MKTNVTISNSKSLFLLATLIFVCAFFSTCKRKNFSLPAIDLSFDKNYNFKKNETLDIYDYYYLLPFSLVPFSHREEVVENVSSAKAYEWHLKESDMKHGYLKFSCEGSFGSEFFEIAIWKRKNRPDLIGRVHTKCNDSGCNNLSSVRFLEFSSNKWKDLTTKVFPKIEFEDFEPEKEMVHTESYVEQFGPFISCYLPQNGLDIICRINKRKEELFEKPQIKLLWKEEKFEIEEDFFF